MLTPSKPAAAARSQNATCSANASADGISSLGGRNGPNTNTNSICGLSKVLTCNIPGVENLQGGDGPPQRPSPDVMAPVVQALARCRLSIDGGAYAATFDAE